MEPPAQRLREPRAEEMLTPKPPNTQHKERGRTYSEKPFHFSRYSTLPFTTRRSRTFSTTYSSSSSSKTSSTFFLFCFFPIVLASFSAYGRRC